MSTQAIKTLGFIGGGNMAEAIIRGILAKGIFSGDQIVVTDKSGERRDFLAKTFPIRVVPTNLDVLTQADAIMFAVKPQNVVDVMTELRDHLKKDYLFLSILAGTRAATLEAGLRSDKFPRPRVVRVMPNTPALIGMGMAGISRGTHATDSDVETAKSIFNSVGKVIVIEEVQMDAMTALSGSGPAYLFYVIESLIEAGVEIGFSSAESEKIVLQMVVGSAMLARESGKPVEELRRQVTSPGGTTAAGIAVLDSREVRDDFIAAVVAAEQRGQQLGKQSR
jgi:pyrroline-5-carboxylate reductase